MLWPSGSAYFFSGDQYVKYDPATDTVPAGYPAAIAGGLAGSAVRSGAGAARRPAGATLRQRRRECTGRHTGAGPHAGPGARRADPVGERGSISSSRPSPMAAR